MWSVKRKYTVVLLGLAALLSLAIAASAQELGSSTVPTAASEPVPPAPARIRYRIDQPTVLKGYTAAAPDGALKLSLVPGILAGETEIFLEELAEDLPMPWKYDRISPVWQFDIRSVAAYDGQRPFYIEMAYNEAADGWKRIFFYDRNLSGWRPLPTVELNGRRAVRALIHLPFARLAVFSDPRLMAAGTASWYTHKNGLFAASPDYPAGSRLRVTSLASGKFVDVTVNDFGPDRALHPERVIDLDRTAFIRLAPTGAGVIKVRVQPLQIPGLANAENFAVDRSGEGREPKLAVRSGLLMDGEGRSLWERDAGRPVPIASLTKILAMKIFLDSGASLDQVIAYDKQDERYNHEFAEPWESARLKLQAGEQATARDHLYAALVGSANNSVETLVRASGLPRSQFIALMNDTARAWGATTSRFVEPTGLSPENTASPADYAIITRHALADPVLVAASTAKEYKFTTIDTKKPHTIKNSNTLVRSGQYRITGSKTGYLEEAGYCLMTRATVNGREFLAMTFGAANRDDSFGSIKELLYYAGRAANTAALSNYVN